jgi:hypothetical protein
MSISASSGMSWLPAQVVPNTTSRHVWTPPAPAPLPAAATAPVSNAGAALLAGQRTGAEQAFLFGLKIAFSDADRASAARRLLAYATGVSNADLQNDPALGALVALSQSIIARTQPGTGSWFSGAG